VLHGSECRDLLGDLYERCIPSVVRRARRLLGTEAEAWEVVQDTFLKLLEHCPHVMAHTRPMALVTVAAVNRCYNRMKSLKYRPTEVLTDDGGPGFMPDIVEARNSLRQLSRLVDEQTFQIAFLCWMEGMSQEEAAVVLGLSRKTVGKKLKQLQDLASSLTAAGEAT